MPVTGSIGRWRRLDELFGRAAAVPARSRRAFLDLECGDTPLRREIARLLDADADGNRLLDRALTAGEALSQALPRLRPGHRVGDWRVRGLLGRGGMGIVYRVARVSQPSGAGAAGALKLVCDGKCTPEGEARFANEQRALQSIRHPRIPRLLDAGKSGEGYCYLVSELVAGISIAQWARRRSLGVGARLRLVADACTAVAHLHDRGLVHLDLKSDNLLVTACGQVHLLDLGEVQRLDLGERAAGEQLALTARYAAPEQFAGRAPTAATDVYALGRVAEELLTRPSSGRLPGGAAAYPTVERVLRRALQADPSRRYTNARALGTALRRAPRRLQGTDG